MGGLGEGGERHLAMGPGTVSLIPGYRSDLRHPSVPRTSNYSVIITHLRIDVIKGSVCECTKGYHTPGSLYLLNSTYIVNLCGGNQLRDLHTN